MFSSQQYQLLDFGAGRRLERFGPFVLDRPCPPAERVIQRDPPAWELADAQFVRTGKDRGQWRCLRDFPERWTISHGPLVFELKRTEFGHLGIFCEQASQWDWLAERIGKMPRPVRLLNLFAYTGGSTLAAAAAGAEVVHVDAARNVIAWARRNAERSGLSDAPIRWIAEDARKFVRRECKRGRRYDAVILDPPSYGHGPRGEVWRLSKHLPKLLAMCGELTAGRRQFLLLTCHTPGFDPDKLKGLLHAAVAETEPGALTAAPLKIHDAAGRELPSGVVARWDRRRPENA